MSFLYLDLIGEDKEPKPKQMAWPLFSKSIVKMFFSPITFYLQFSNSCNFQSHHAISVCCISVLCPQCNFTQSQDGLMHLGPNVKIDYIVLDVKLLLIHMNNIEFFLFLEIL